MGGSGRPGSAAVASALDKARRTRHRARRVLGTLRETSRKRGFRLLSSLGLAVVVSGCAVPYGAPVVPPPGVLFSNVSAPIDIDMEKTQVTPQRPKMGEASVINVLGFFAFGDCSIQAAAEDGGLATIEHLDYSHLNILYLFQKFTIRAYGS